MNERHVSWVFVCQSGELEWEACVLAASMRETLGDAATLIAAVPTPVAFFGRLEPAVMDVLDSLGVIRCEFENRLFAREDAKVARPPLRTETRETSDRPGRPSTGIHPGPSTDSRLLMNKAFALQCVPDAQVVVFVDSDQVCYAPFDYSDLTVPMIGRRAFYPGAIATDGVWERAYEVCETAMPRQRLLVRSRDPTQRPVVVPPYFNSGLISVHRPWLHELVENYINCYSTIAQHDLLGAQHYYEEQMALAIAVVKTGVPYEIDHHRLDRSFFHYYTLRRLQAFPRHAAKVAALTGHFEGLSDLLSTHAGWQAVLQTGHRRRDETH